MATNNGGNATAAFWRGAAVGAASSLAGAGAGALANGLLPTAFTHGGFLLNGAITGAAGGFAAGFVAGAGNAWANGASFSQGLNAGMTAGGFGALGGAVMGGISGEIGYQQMNKEVREICAVLGNQGIKPDANGGYTPSTETLNAFADAHFKEFSFRAFANYLYKEGYVEAINPKYDAITDPNNPVKGVYNVYFAKSAFSSGQDLYLAMGHENIHVVHLHRFGLSWNRNLSEYAAYKWSYTASRYESFKVEFMKYEALLKGSPIGPKTWNKYADVYNYGINSKIPKGL